MLQFEQVCEDLKRALGYYSSHGAMTFGILVEADGETVEFHSADSAPTSLAIAQNTIPDLWFEGQAFALDLPAASDVPQALFIWRLKLPDPMRSFAKAIVWAIGRTHERRTGFFPLHFRQFAAWCEAHLTACFSKVSPYYMIGRAFQVRAPKLALRIAAAKSGATSAILWIYDPKNHTFSASVVVNAASGDYVLSAGKGIVGQLTPVRSVVSFDIASPGGVRPFHPDLFDAEGWKRCTAFSICSRGLLLGAISFYWDRELSEQQPDRDRLTDISGLRIADMASGYVAADLAEIAEADEIDRLEAIIVKQGPAQALMSFMHDIQKSLRDAMTAMNAASVYLAGGNQAAKAMAVHLQESSSFINVCMNRALRLALLQQRVPAFKRVDLARLVEDLRPLIELSATVKVKSRIPKGPIFVQGDRIDIERSIFNVVENAIYWTDIKLSGERVVNVRLIRESIHAIIEVEDTGVGVGPEMRDRVFERFVTGRPESGTGMGLFLVSRVMLAHGGSVDFSDNDHGGTTFRLRFPLSERQRE